MQRRSFFRLLAAAAALPAVSCRAPEAVPFTAAKPILPRATFDPLAYKGSFTWVNYNAHPNDRGGFSGRMANQ